MLFGWYRLVCANGMVIGETKVEIRERHDAPLGIDQIPERIVSSFPAVEADRQRLEGWGRTPIDLDSLVMWIDGPVADLWGKTAAARVFHICRSGHDVQIENFARGAASEKPVRLGAHVPGSPKQARTLYDVSQALSFVATRRTDTDDRLSRQAAIPALLQKLSPRSTRPRGSRNTTSEPRRFLVLNHG